VVTIGLKRKTKNNVQFSANSFQSKFVNFEFKIENMETIISISKLNALPNHLKKEVNDFVEFLLEKEKKKVEVKKPNDMMKYAGIITDEEAELWKKSIEEGCGNIDYDGWK
jgi:galactose-1-phosphate uridylyltransferase